MSSQTGKSGYDELRERFLEDVHEGGLEAALESHARAIVGLHASAAAPQRMLGRDLLELLTADPRLRAHFDGLAPEQTAELERELATHTPSAAASPGSPATAPLEPPAGAPATPKQPPAHRGPIGWLREDLRAHLIDHPELRESDGSPMQCVEHESFENWGRTVRNSPELTVVPRTKGGVASVVRWATEHGRTVRAAGYRHSWSDVFSADDQVLVSLLPLYDVEHLPSPEPPIDPHNELQGIELVGTVVEDGQTKALCRIGAATTNEQFRRWCLDEHGGAWKWTVPLNTIIVELTWGGSNAPICHGAGRRHPTLSDLVVAVELVNAKGELQVVSDPQLLRAASGCFGLLGIVTALTIKLDPMSYAKMRPERQRLPLTIPPPAGFAIPPEVDMSGITQAEMDEAWDRFVAQCEDDYYAEWFWFPYRQDCWINCWKNDGTREQAAPYPSDWETLAEQVEGYLAELVTTSTVFKLLPGRWQAKLLGAAAMAGLPHGTIVTPLIEALHFRRGAQNWRILDMELEIPVPPRADDPSRPDWSICQKAWWAAIANVFERSDAPMRVTLEMRVMAGSGVTMAPQYGNLATCSIEVLTTLVTEPREWAAFTQEIADLWGSYSDAHGARLNVRPHWAKEWQEIRFQDRPAVEYLRDVAYAERIPELRAGLHAIAAQGGYEPAALRMFSNPLLDELFGAVFD